MKNTMFKSLFILGTSIAVVSCNNGKDSSTVSSGDTSTTTISSSPAVTDHASTSGMDTTTINQGNSSNATNSGMTNEFVTKAGQGGMMEVELGKLAQTNASSAAVKAFGNMMSTDHSKANSELMSIASAENISAPSGMSEEMNTHINAMKAMKGAEFDKAYIGMMVDDHVKDIDEFKEAAKSNSDQKVKDFAAKTLPTLQKHLASAKAIKAKM